MARRSAYVKIMTEPVWKPVYRYMKETNKQAKAQGGGAAAGAPAGGGQGEAQQIQPKKTIKKVGFDHCVCIGNGPGPENAAKTLECNAMRKNASVYTHQWYKFVSIFGADREEYRALQQDEQAGSGKCGHQ